MRASFREFDPARDEAALIDLLTTESWDYRAQRTLTEEDVREELVHGGFAGEDVVTLLIEVDGDVVGIVRADDLHNDRADPHLDFRLRERARGMGIGLQALQRITEEVFRRDPAATRIEGQTRQDHVAMRQVFVRGGYVKEAVYRGAWPSADGRMYDGIGYAILRSDWESGTTTPVVWTDP